MTCLGCLYDSALPHKGAMCKKTQVMFLIYMGSPVVARLCIIDYAEFTNYDRGSKDSTGDSNHFNEDSAYLSVDSTYLCKSSSWFAARSQDMPWPVPLSFSLQYTMLYLTISSNGTKPCQSE